MSSGLTNRILPQNVPIKYAEPVTSDEKRSSSDIELEGGAKNSGDLVDEKDASDLDPAGINAVGHINIYDDVPASAADDNNNVNAGVRKAQQGQAVWGKYTRWILFFGLTMASYVYALDGVTTYQYLLYATSAAGNHAQIGTVQVAASIITSVGRPMMAKLADTIGRAETYCIVCACYCVGYVLLGASQTIGQIAGGTIVYAFGSSGLDLLTSIIVADATTLRWRGLVSALMTQAYVINAFVASEIIEGMVPDQWRWGYYMFVIILPVCLAPVISILFWSQIKASRLERERLAARDQSRAPRMPALAALKKFGSDMDIVGLFLVAASLALILLPLGLAGREGTTDGWSSPSTIVTLIVGVALLPVLCIWEFKYATVPLAPKRFFSNRNILASISITFVDFISFYLVLTYQYSFVAIVKTGAWTARSQSYFSQTLTVATCIFAIPTGLYMAWSRRYKWLTVFGLLVRLLSCGIMIRGRGAHGTDFELVVCQLLQGLGAAIAAITCQVASQAGVTHSDVGTVTALVLLFGGVGASIGSTITTAIWVNSYPGQLQKFVAGLPGVDQLLIDTIYADPTTVAMYELDDPIRLGVTEAVSSVMGTMCIIATVVAVFPPIIAWLLMEDLPLGDVQNNVDQRRLDGSKLEMDANGEAVQRT